MKELLTDKFAEEAEAEQTYCGCGPQCQAVWDTDACDDALGGCHTCGERIEWQSNNGGNINMDDACRIVANDFPSGPCEVCNPDTCDGNEAPAPPATGVCSDGQIYVVNNCGETLRHGSLAGTKTIQSGCEDLLGHAQRIWVGSADSKVSDDHITLFEYTYWLPPWSDHFQINWDVSLLTGYNYPVKVENNDQTLLDVTGPSCGGADQGLFPCSQEANTCVENTDKWKPTCAGCNSSCCDMNWVTNKLDHRCDPPDIDNTQNIVLTFCPNENEP